MKWIARIIALPIGATVGVIAWLLIYMAIFDSLALFPLSMLAMKLAPGVVGGVTLAYIYPGLFIWFMDVEVEGEVDISSADEESKKS